MRTRPLLPLNPIAPPSPSTRLHHHVQGPDFKGSVFLPSKTALEVGELVVTLPGTLFDLVYLGSGGLLDLAVQPKFTAANLRNLYQYHTVPALEPHKVRGSAAADRQQHSAARAYILTSPHALGRSQQRLASSPPLTPRSPRTALQVEWVQLKDGSKQNGQPKTLDDYEPYSKDGAKLALSDEEKAKYKVRDGGLQQVQGAAWVRLQGLCEHACMLCAAAGRSRTRRWWRSRLRTSWSGTSPPCWARRRATSSL